MKDGKIFAAGRGIKMVKKKSVLVNPAGRYYNLGKEKGKCYDRKSL